MTVPAITDFVVFTAPQLTGANWNSNCTQIVSYLTNTNYDFSINSMTAKTYLGPLLSGNTKIGTFTRDVSLGAGNVSYTGVGFKPSTIIAAGNLNDVLHYANSIGYTNGTNNMCSYVNDGNAAYTDTSYFININQSGAIQQAAIVTFDADGFTIAWRKTGSPTGTLTVVYLAIK